MIDPAEIPVQAAIVGTSITLTGGIVIAIVGWIVTAKIAKLSRDSAEMIAELTRLMVEQQIAVARAQVDVNRQTQAMNLLKDRNALKDELIEAISARGQEIIKNDHQNGNIETVALHRLWRAEGQARVLFGSDVTDIIKSILETLETRDRLLMKIRINQPREEKLHDEATQTAFRVEELKDDLTITINRYSAMGHIRMLADEP